MYHIISYVCKRYLIFHTTSCLLYFHSELAIFCQFILAIQPVVVSLTILSSAPHNICYIFENDMRYEAGASAGKTRLINHLHGFNLSPCCTRKKKTKIKTETARKCCDKDLATTNWCYLRWRAYRDSRDT